MNQQSEVAYAAERSTRTRRFHMPRAFALAALIACVASVGTVAAQSSGAGRFTAELTAELEADAASALAREAYIQGVRTVCKRVHAGVSELVNEELA